MAKITLKGNPIETIGELPAVGSTAPNFSVAGQDLSDTELKSFAGKKKILNIFASLDTSVCASSVRTFHERAGSRPELVVLNISADLPFASKRFCGAEGIENARTFSTFRSDFPRTYGLQITSGPMKGLCSRAVVVLDEDDKVLYTEQVPEITQEPDYEKALASL